MAELYKQLIQHIKQKIEKSEFAFDDLRDILSKGYFPAKLPPCFNTETFGQIAFISYNELLDIIFQKNINDVVTKYTHYYLARHNQIRRILGILNPMSYFLVTCVFCAYKDVILDKAKSDFSLSSPVKEKDIYPNARAYTQKVDWQDSDVIKLENRAGKLILLQTDISRFYPSIYTHIIPWIVEGKVEAKKSRNNIQKLGNMLDKVFEWAQDGQTFGLPIGPDVTFIIAEMILAHIDILVNEALNKNNCEGVRWIRRVDDCEFACDTKEQANKVLAIVQSILNNFELELNNHKTQISNLPQSIISEEIEDICEHEISSNEQNRKKILNYFNVVFNAFKKNNTKGVLKYAVKSIKQDDLKGNNKNLFISFICQCIVLEEGVSESALVKIANLLKENLLDNKEKEIIKSSLYNVISNHSEQKHTSEVVWALWGLLLLEEQIQDNILNLLCNMEDCFVYLMLLDFASKDLIDKEKIEKSVIKFLQKDKEYFIGKNWLLLYEIIKKEWINPEKYQQYIESDKFFKFLYDNDVSFYQNKATTHEYIELFENWIEDNYGCSSCSKEEQEMLDELLHKE